jgi:metal-dependent hydrolase (beta-lactamase superfamily II)
MNITVFLEGMQSNDAISCGFTWYITTKSYKILIIDEDSTNFWRYAERFGVSVEEIDMVFLLQGCKNSVRGLEYFLSHNEKAKVYLPRANNEMHVYSLYNKLLAYTNAKKISDWKERTIFIDNALAIENDVFIFFKNEKDSSLKNKEQQIITLKEDDIQILFTSERTTTENYSPINYIVDNLSEIASRDAVTIVA